MKARELKRESLETLIEMASNGENPNVRRSAAAALGRKGNRNAMPVLIELLDDPLVNVSAVGALLSLGAFDKAIPGLTIADSRNRRHIEMALTALARSDSEKFKRILTSEGPISLTDMGLIIM